MNTKSKSPGLQSVVAILAVLFGLVTIFAGGRVLLGSDPGYIVFKPLLVYNTVMGIVYVVVGFLMWRDLATGKKASGIVFTLNLIVLIGIVWVFRTGGGVATDSLKAMTFRTVVWLGFYLVLVWLNKRNRNDYS